MSYISADTLGEDGRANEQPYYRVQIKTSRHRHPAGNDVHGRNQHGPQDRVAQADETDHQDVFRVAGRALNVANARAV